MTQSFLTPAWTFFNTFFQNETLQRHWGVGESLRTEPSFQRPLYKQTDVMGFTIHLKFSYCFVCIKAIMPPILMAPFYLTTKCAPTTIPFSSLQRGEGLVAPFYRSSNLRLAHSNHRCSLDVCHAPGTDLLIHYHRPYPQQFWSSE